MVGFHDAGPRVAAFKADANEVVAARPTLSVLGKLLQGNARETGCSDDEPLGGSWKANCVCFGISFF